MIDEALLDDPNSDGGWSLFSKAQSHNNEQDEVESKCSSNSSVMSDQHYVKTELDLDYF